MVAMTDSLENALDEKTFHQLKHSLKNSQGISYHSFKKTLRPSYATIWIQILSGWIFLIGILVLLAYSTMIIETPWLNILFTVVTSLLIGFTVNYLLNFFHEAAHFNISPSKKGNDLSANIFLGILQAQGIKHYRVVHWQHHVHLGETADTERSYFDALTARFIIESLTGIRAFKIFIFRNNNVSTQANNKVSADVIKEGQHMLFFGILFHTTVLVLFFLIHQYWLIAAWLLGFGTFFPFFSSLRQLLEHRSELADKAKDYRLIAHGKLSRLFNNNLVASLFGSAGFTRHLLHHFEPQISYTNLKEVETFLLDTDLGPALQKQKTSYSKVFIALLGK